ncbi:hypothetical protein [Methylobacterium flocculans]|uniref:hypothetical protein n=1 Tax=Methylobacterium flocculans TaxID=2984843 RepID=UPI0021F38CC7|nr:hypothetical protein [Methylobacterium sp. FF17]
MSRAFSQAFRAALLAENTDEAVAALVTISHPELAGGPLRASSYPGTCVSIDPYLLGVVSRGQTFLYVEFAFTPPEDREDQEPAFEIRMDNVARETVALLRSTGTPALVTVEIIAVDRPDLVEVEFADFDLVSAEHDEETVTLGLALDDMSSEPYPADCFTPSNSPGLF